MTPRVRSTNLARPKPDPTTPRLTGIDKHPVPSIEVFEPGPNYGDGPGVVDDLVGDVRHHGGMHKAVYAFSREELDWWSDALGRDLRDGAFGENLTTEDFDLDAILVNQRVRLGDVVLEASISRQPCATFARHMGVPGWVKRFAQHGRCGTYFRVVTPGTIHAGVAFETVGRPSHDVDMATVFAAEMGDQEAARRVVAAEVIPAQWHDRLAQRLAGAGEAPRVTPGRSPSR
ncbi:MAG: MOSC domain-containing protein [Propionibacteriaceae bacterium]|nr:MOSC domain-containing protein [Propionibacteriaceae bacterium]